MKVARVTVTAMTQGLMAGRSEAAYGRGKEAVVELIQGADASLTPLETGRSHLMSGTIRLATAWSQGCFGGLICARASRPGGKSFVRRRRSSINGGTTVPPCPISSGI